MTAAVHTPTYVRAVVEAAAWRAQLSERGVSSAEAFETWLAADPLHEQAWSETQATSDFVDDFATAPEMLTARREALAHAQRQGQARWLGWGRGGWAAAAVLLVLILGAGGSAWLRGQPQVYQTALGERRVIPLADGSKVSLDSASRVKVRYTRDARRLELLAGQARFDVAHNPLRPFSVTAHDQTVIATGTAFNIDMIGARVLVTLIEGRVVVVDAARSRPFDSRAPAFPAARPKAVLIAGQQLVTAPAQPDIVQPISLERATAWESGQLIFDNEPIAEVVARVSRYTTQSITVDAAARDLRVSGVFKTGDTQTFLDAVTNFLPLRARREANGDTVLRRRD